MERARPSGLASLAGENPPEDLEDFDALVRLHRPRVFRFILASLRDRETAENLTQDCFVKAYQARDQFRGASSIGTWFMRIAANLVRDHESPETMALIQEQVQAIWSAAAGLPVRQRTVFLLRFVEDMDFLPGAG